MAQNSHEVFIPFEAFQAKNISSESSIHRDIQCEILKKMTVYLDVELDDGEVLFISASSHQGPRAERGFRSSLLI